MAAGSWVVLGFHWLVLFLSSGTVDAYDDRNWIYNLLASSNDVNPIAYPNTEWDISNYQPLVTNTALQPIIPTAPTVYGQRAMINKRFFGGEGLDKKRFQFGGLVCCNHPPTRPPRKSLEDKRALADDDLRNFILSTLMHSSMDGAVDDQMDVPASSLSGYWSAVRSALEKNSGDQSASEPWQWSSADYNNQPLRMDRRDKVKTKREDLLSNEEYVPAQFSAGQGVYFKRG